MADAPTELDPQLQILGALRQLRERAYWTAFAHGLLRAGFWGCFAALPLALAPGPLTPVALALLVSGKYRVTLIVAIETLFHAMAQHPLVIRGQ